jgi:hypothetical protein
MAGYFPLLFASSRHRSPLTVVVSGLGLYSVFAVIYHYLVRPTVNDSAPQAAVQHFAIPAAARAEEVFPLRVRFVSAVAARTSEAEKSGVAEPRIFKPGEKTNVAKPKKISKRGERSDVPEPKKFSNPRERSERHHRSNRSIAWRPFPFFRPWF